MTTIKNARLAWRVGICAMVALVVVGAIASFFIYRSHQEKDFQEAILEVCQQRLIARSNSFEMGGPGHRFTNLNEQKLVAQLRKIDTAGCPKKFREAWLQYRQAWERKAEYGIGGLIVDGMDGWAATKAPSVLANVTAGIRQRDSEEPWRTVERAALESGIDITSLE